MRKRIQIRVPKKAAAIDLNDEWNTKLAPAVTQIFTKDQSLLSFEILYDSVYRLVLQEHGKQLWKRLQLVIKDHLVALKQTLVLTDQATVLKSIGDAWTDFSFQMKMISDVFMYLNRSYCDEAHVLRTEAAGLASFAEIILSEDVRIRLYDQFVSTVDRGRRQEPIDHTDIRVITGMLETLSPDHDRGVSVFDAELRPRLIQATTQFYTTAMNGLMTSEACEIVKVLNQWIEGRAGAEYTFLPNDVIDDIVKALQGDVILPKLTEIWTMPSGVTEWFGSNDLPSLHLAGVLEAKCNDLSPISDRDANTDTYPSNEYHSTLTDEVGGVVSAAQIKINTAASNDDWIRQTLDLYKRVETIAATIPKPGDGSRKLRTSSIITALVTAMNECRQMPEFLAQYLDGMLRKQTGVTPSDAEIDEGLREALVIFDALQEPDRFSLHFKRQLARRLLLNRSRSEDLELSWLQRLKASERGGSQFVFEFQRMLKDMHASREVNNVWRQYYQTVQDELDNDDGSSSTKKKSLPKINANVLAKLVWPSNLLPSDASQTKLPEELEEMKARFEEWYLKAHFRRRLDWNYGLGTAEIKINVAAGSYTASVPVVTTAILNLFKGDEELTIEQASELSGVPMGGELERHLKPILFGKANLLLKSPNTPDLKPKDILKFNENFHSPTLRFKVQAVAARKSTQSTDNSQIEMERMQKAQAAIVRIMKARKELGHASLVQETAAILSRTFRASPQTIKKAIQALLDKEYIKRGKDTQTYIYLA